MTSPAHGGKFDGADDALAGNVEASFDPGVLHTVVSANTSVLVWEAGGSTPTLCSFDDRRAR